MKEIEEFLRETKPQVKDDPTFLLETRQRMAAVEGIKAEVDRQRSHSRMALVVTLVIGLALGLVAASVAFLYPVDAVSVKDGLWESVCLFLATWKQYLLLPVAVLAIALGVVLSKGKASYFRM